ncbi:MAG TPA: phosphotransferase [Petrotogaceae bacterium]|nr:phosphotransferase [Petrotogaceae bacterium]HQF33728.1 phosphotransferase [Petrotogaceae bacterium]HQI78674.1 phosphotransferase [Petrotogaceae bacterium]
MHIEKCIGTGRTADVYEYGKEYIIKLFKSGFRVGSEGKNSKTINSLESIRSPKLIDIIEIKGNQAIVYEKIIGPTMMEKILCEPQNQSYYADMLAHIQYQMHKEVSSLKPNLKEEIKKKIRSSSKIRDSVKDYALKKTEIINSSCAICHYDFHPGNIVLSENGPVIIDWANVLIGDERADVSRTSLMLRAHISQNGIKPYSIAEFSENNDFHSRYLKTYIKNGSIDIEELSEFEVITASVRLAEDIKEENDFLQEIIKNSICERRGKSE